MTTRMTLAVMMISTTLASSRAVSQSQAPSLDASSTLPSSVSSAAPQKSAVSTCLEAAREHAAAALKNGATRLAARQQLETEAASCVDPSLTPAQAQAIGKANSDRARLSVDFLEGRITLAAYRARLGLRPDPSDTRNERRLREILAGARFLYNPSCEDAPRPQIPMPLEWGRGPQTKHKTAGFNLAVAKVSGQPAGCEIFYEIQLRFIDPNSGNPSLPPSKIVTMVFSGGEDLLTDPRRAVFGIPMNEPISPARAEAREAFAREYARATWRVRAVNGSNRTSAWSSFVTQGPASSGVQG
jgi:hypothetical protein